MDPDRFRASLADAAPPPDLPAPLAALWWAERGPAGFDRAHALAQEAEGPDAAWVHAHLHRAEGDLGNAAYWYRRAGRPVAEGPLPAERAAIATALLRAG
ncbi:hypothetical protein [Methylobacterium planeticum]|uniref:Sel1 repeat family protein n=1 Tax=Methylobacterium planeticum TaxID=2615211 RepID=A0A6N6MIH6_9HYPH|nr:hypothetical protein [Methylobacterium planeticum]KAB1070220.1 hypothetical protein F6X51_23355 [Methylobacterium planeticum]